MAMVRKLFSEIHSKVDRETEPPETREKKRNMQGWLQNQKNAEGGEVVKMQMFGHNLVLILSYFERLHFIADLISLLY